MEWKGVGRLVIVARCVVVVGVGVGFVGVVVIGGGMSKLKGTFDVFEGNDLMVFRSEVAGFGRLSQFVQIRINKVISVVS